MWSGWGTAVAKPTGNSGVGVFVGDGVMVGVAVFVGVGVMVGLAVAVGTGASVGVAVGGTAVASAIWGAAVSCGACAQAAVSAMSKIIHQTCFMLCSSMIRSCFLIGTVFNRVRLGMEWGFAPNGGWEFYCFSSTYRPRIPASVAVYKYVASPMMTMSAWPTPTLPGKSMMMGLSG